MLSFLAATLLALPLSWKGMTGIYAWFSPFILLNSLFVLKSLVLLNLLGILVLILSLVKKRWFCRTLCPVGWTCDSISSLSKRKNFSLRHFPPLGRWFAWISLAAALLGIPVFIYLDPMALFHGFFSAFSGKFSWLVILSMSGLPVLLAIHLFFPGIWCTRLCPLGGLQDEITSLKKFLRRLLAGEKLPRQEFAGGRRLFLASGIGVAAGFLIPGFLKNRPVRCFRPPASQAPRLFNALCLRCGNCMKACPSDIIVHHKDSSDPESWMTPEVSFSNFGYCLSDCNLCGRVCPSGAINLFTLEAKREIVMGLAEIHLEECLLTHLTECTRCKDACSYDAIDIVPLGPDKMMSPVVDEKLCVGCGACAAICPPVVIKMVLPDLA